MYNSQGQVLGAAVSVLPATVAYSIFPSLHSMEITMTIATLVGVWAVSYVGVNSVMRFIKK